MHKRINRKLNRVEKVALIHDGELTLSKDAPTVIFDEAKKSISNVQAASAAVSLGSGGPVAVNKRKVEESTPVVKEESDADNDADDTTEVGNLLSFLAEASFQSASAMPKAQPTPAAKSAAAKQRPQAAKRQPAESSKRQSAEQPKRRKTMEEPLQAEAGMTLEDPDEVPRRRGRKQITQLDQEDKAALEKLQAEFETLSSLEASTLEDFQYYGKVQKSMSKVQTALAARQRMLQRRNGTSNMAADFEEFSITVKMAIAIAKAFGHQDGDKLQELFGQAQKAMPVSLNLMSQMQHVKLLAFADLASGRWAELEHVTFGLIGRLQAGDDAKASFVQVLTTTLFQRLLRGKSSCGLTSTSSLAAKAFDFMREFAQRVPAIVNGLDFVGKELARDIANELEVVEGLLHAHQKTPADVKKALELVEWGKQSKTPMMSALTSLPAGKHIIALAAQAAESNVQLNELDTAKEQIEKFPIGVELIDIEVIKSFLDTSASVKALKAKHSKKTSFSLALEVEVRLAVLEFENVLCSGSSCCNFLTSNFSKF